MAARNPTNKFFGVFAFGLLLIILIQRPMWVVDDTFARIRQRYFHRQKPLTCNAVEISASRKQEAEACYTFCAFE